LFDQATNFNIVPPENQFARRASNGRREKIEARAWQARKPDQSSIKSGLASLLCAGNFRRARERERAGIFSI
jgi:hypothetical protein